MRSAIAALLSLVVAASALQSLPLRPFRGIVQARAPSLLCSGSKGGQGFGTNQKPKPSPKKKNKKAAAPASFASTPVAVPQVPAATQPGISDEEAQALSAAEVRGRKLLEELRNQAGEEPELLKRNKPKKVVLTEEELRPMDPTEGVMPDVVADRMLGRILPFVAAPIGLGVLVFIGFWFANTQLNLDLPPTIVAYATQACLLLSFAGITFGVMSTNLDEEAEQSALGMENVQRNIDVMRGAQDSRIADAKLEEEEEVAMRGGILLSQKAAAKRDRQQQ